MTLCWVEARRFESKQKLVAVAVRRRDRCRDPCRGRRRRDRRTHSCHRVAENRLCRCRHNYATALIGLARTYKSLTI